MLPICVVNPLPNGANFVLFYFVLCLCVFISFLAPKGHLVRRVSTLLRRVCSCFRLSTPVRLAGATSLFCMLCFQARLFLVMLFLLLTHTHAPSLSLLTLIGKLKFVCLCPGGAHPSSSIELPFDKGSQKKNHCCSSREVTLGFQWS